MTVQDTAARALEFLSGPHKWDNTLGYRGSPEHPEAACLGNALALVKLGSLYPQCWRDITPELACAAKIIREQFPAVTKRPGDMTADLVVVVTFNDFMAEFEDVQAVLEKMRAL